jgi:hypothetical protein
MRKRHAARPHLEPMEARLFPSAIGAHLTAEQVVAARVAQLEAHSSQKAAAQVTRSEAATQHHHAVKHAHTTHHATTTGHKSTQSSSTLSNFFKSIFPGL